MQGNLRSLVLVLLAALIGATGMLLAVFVGNSADLNRPTFVQYAGGQLFASAWRILFPFLSLALVVGAIVCIGTLILQTVVWHWHTLPSGLAMWLLTTAAMAITLASGLMSGLLISSVAASISVHVFGANRGWHPFSPIWFAQLSGLVAGMGLTGGTVGIAAAAALWHLVRPRLPGLRLEWLVRTLVVRSQLSFLACVLVANIIAASALSSDLSDTILRFGGLVVGATLGYRTVVVTEDAQ